MITLYYFLYKKRFYKDIEAEFCELLKGWE